MSVQIGSAAMLTQAREPAIPTHDRAGNFAARLAAQGGSGLADHTGQAAGLHAGPAAASVATDVVPDSELGSSLLRVRPVPGKGSEKAVTELYALGLRAGAHLSHLPSFLSEGRVAGAVPGMSTGPDLPGGRALVPASSGPAVTQSVVSPQLALISAPQRAEVASQRVQDAVHREAGALIAARWPERRWQVVTHADGVSLLIRDYQLSAEEEMTLLADLTSRLAVLDMAPARIWVNGRQLSGEEHAMTNLTGGA